MQHMFFFEEKMQHMLPWCSLEEAPVMLSASRWSYPFSSTNVPNKRDQMPTTGHDPSIYMHDR